MNAENKPTHLRFSPKVIAVILIALAVVVFSGLYLFRTVLNGSVLESIDSGSFRFDLCGNGTLSQIKVYRNGKQTATVKVSSVGNADNRYGVTVTDLNFDGYPDLLVVRSQDATETHCDAWLWNNATGTFRASEALAGVVDPTLSEEYGCVISQRSERRDAGEDANGSYYEEAEIISVYAAADGEIVEFSRYEFVYFTKNDIYAYRIYRYDADRGILSSFSEDDWLSPDEAIGFDLSEHAESDMADHKSDYPNAELFE